MTEQEQKLKKALFILIKNAGNMLKVHFFTQNEAQENISYGNIIKSHAIKNNNVINLYLVEPTNPAELNDWADAIVKAEELVDMVLAERVHEYQNPNYFKAICAKYRDLNH